VKGPGVKSYRVQEYVGASGKQVTRVEFNLAPGAAVNLAAVTGGLQINVQGDSAEPAEAPGPAPKPAAIAPSRQPAVIGNITVVRGTEALEVAISGKGVLSPRALKLTDPDRLVVDLDNAVPGLRARTINVNSGGVKAIRVGRYQSEPPVTRVVVDLAKAYDYELVPAGSTVTLKIRTPELPAAVASVEVVPTPASRTQPAQPVALAAPREEPKPVTPVAQNVPAARPVEPPKPAPAANVVAVEPKVEIKPASAEAAAAFAAAKAETSVDPGLLAPASISFAPRPAVNLAQQQQQQLAQPTPATAPRYTGEPISVNLKDVDLRDFFRLIHEISGLNIVLDPNVKGSLTLVLDDVPWDQALDIVLKNNSLDRQLEGNVLRIATVATITK
jgi:type IV pilus assembly protein PilQ